MLGTCIERVLRVFGKTDSQIQRIRLRWSVRFVRSLPRAVYSRTRKLLAWYDDQSQTEHAVLQRMHQLNQEGGEEVYRYNLHPDIPSRPISANEDRTSQALRRLRTKLLNIRAQLRRSWNSEPDNTLMWIVNSYWRTNRYEDGRSHYWAYYRQRCADRGGCCGRACGCCEKPLDEYWIRNCRRGAGLKETMFLEKVYGHCTSECACCVITHGVYEPDPRLPRPDFVVGGRSSS
ncbi:hypothetical protein ASPSYDRAFT_48063 [Aspergillus sydowii CBS 593.65]|uniref:Uncharacterized protein n=1 Tax=Aspergillus sydowii CBS 593.65 TaxID=1036612 RepID=A0A1L9T8P6_9EURO|nr:uncharacterized protein ASPSYDRAFT_48063 [Aspergillus sydowii CBS 593.65]OJJ55818.1 hypothetical protein ASPSYDRAFT_48063 [Aspergillus sydowii CBS 593.65]